MSGDELRIVADVFREAADPLPDGDERARAGWLAALFDTAADRIDAGTTTTDSAPLPTMTSDVPSPAPPAPDPGPDVPDPTPGVPA